MAPVSFLLSSVGVRMENRGGRMQARTSTETIAELCTVSAIKSEPGWRIDHNCSPVKEDRESSKDAIALGKLTYQSLRQDHLDSKFKKLNFLAVMDQSRINSAPSPNPIFASVIVKLHYH